MAKLSLDMEDSKGFVGSTLPAIGSVYRHKLTERFYTVADIVWIGDSDEWGIYHTSNMPDTDVAVVRSASNFLDPERFQHIS